MACSTLTIPSFLSSFFHMLKVLRARRKEKELKVKPATSFKCFQYLSTKSIFLLAIREFYSEHYICFTLQIYRKPMHFLKTCTVNMKE